MADKLQVLMQFEICDRHFFVFIVSISSTM